MIKLTVVIPTYNREEVLRKTLLALVSQTVNKSSFEVIIIDDGSGKKAVEFTKSLVRSLPYQTTFLLQNHRGPASARNLGIKKAKGKIVLIINDDTVPSPELVERHLLFHKENTDQSHALLGYLTWHKDLEITPFMHWLENGGPYFSYQKIRGKIAGWQKLWTCNISFKRDFLLDNGLFDEEFREAAWEDVELGYRLSKKGFRLFYDKKAIGFHYHPTSVQTIKNKMMANGRAAILLRAKLPYNLLPPIAKPKITKTLIAIDRLFSLPILLAEKMAIFLENKYVISFLYELVLLHYRILGVKSFFSAERK